MNDRGLLLLIVPWLLLTSFALIHHEPWRDEADVWLSVRDSSLGSVLSRASHSGTPILWYLLVLPLARAGLPYWTMGVLHLLVTAAAVLVFLGRASLPRLTKVLFVFSYYMIFEYAVVARNYAPSILILFLIAALYPLRFRRPVTYALLLALLFQTNVHSFLIGYALGAVYVDEMWRKQIGRRRIVTALLVAGAILTVAQLLPRPGGQFSVLHVEFRPGVLLWASKGMFFPMIPVPMLSLFTVAFLSALVCGLWRKRRLLLLLAALFSLLFYLLLFKWSLPDGYRHFGLLLIVVIFILWIEPFEQPAAGPTRPWENRATRAMQQILNLGLASLCMVGVFVLYQEIRYDFSGARRMARYLIDSGLARQTIVAHRATAASALLPYLPDKQFWYAGIERYGTFMEWDNSLIEGQKLSNEGAVERMRRTFGNRSDVLLLLNSPLSNPQQFCLRLRYSGQTPVFAKSDESFYLYEPDRSGGCLTSPPRSS